MKAASASSINFTSRRALSSQSLLSSRRPVARIAQQVQRRTYADLAPGPATKPKRFKPLKTIWRLTYLTAIGGAAYLAYGVYELRHPDDQFEPDPTKKNLVILGIYPNWLRMTSI